jgi:UDP-perosamine 4-acetyltransferase
LRPKLVIVGGGGHARVILDILERAGDFEVVGFTSREAEERTEALSGYPRLGTDEALSDLFKSGVRHAFIAVGDNKRREMCFRMVTSMGFSMVNAISRDAIISARASLGNGVAIIPGAIVNIGAVIGDGVIVNTNASVDHDCVIGAFAHIAPGTALAGNVKVGCNALLGMGSRVIPDITIGPNSTVDAGAVVINALPADLLAVGVPAAVKKQTG